MDPKDPLLGMHVKGTFFWGLKKSIFLGGNLDPQGTSVPGQSHSTLPSICCWVGFPTTMFLLFRTVHNNHEGTWLESPVSFGFFNPKWIPKESCSIVTVLNVGGFNPFGKYARQIGSFPQIGVKIPKIFELPPPRQSFSHQVHRLRLHSVKLTDLKLVSIEGWKLIRRILFGMASF